jgi:hypothetical protein
MKTILLFSFVFTASFFFAQKATLSGVVTDEANSQTVIGAVVKVNETLHAVTDYEGRFSIENIPYGTYTVEFLSAGYADKKQEIKIEQAQVYLTVALGTEMLKEVEVIGNIAKDRETPVAVTSISNRQLREELGSRDLPMVLNASPGVYATRQGGGDGDARITIRGFDQRNVAVMIDGVPVNDMENGWVYWSNWFGLDAITQTVQVQRGLGATKIAIPSVGGTMNIITQNIGNKFGFSFKQELSTGLTSRTSFSISSGQLKKGWGLLFSGSYKKGQGYVNGTTTEGAFYYVKIQKRTGNHITTLSAFGAPQKHGQRSYQQPIDYWNAKYAAKLGIDTTGAANHGIKYNEHWGYRTVNGKNIMMNERLNYFHKPQITLKDFWNINKKLSWSNIAYVSIGHGGGTALRNYSGAARDSVTGQIDWDQITYNNQYTTFPGFPAFPNYAPKYDSSGLKANNVLTSSINNHFWVGYVSQLNYKINSSWDFSAGIDARYYKGVHYQTAFDMLGGSYFVDNNGYADQNTFNSTIITQGQKLAKNSYNKYRDAIAQWYGGYTQAEYSKGRWTAFINLSGVAAAYRGRDYFVKKQVQVGDTTLNIGYNDTINYNGQTYTRNTKGLQYNQTPWKWLPGFTFKAGGNVNIDENNNIFLNLGVLSRPPQFSNVVDNDYNNLFTTIKNENIYAAEIGYGLKTKRVTIRVNGYGTFWQNKPFPFGVQIPDPKDPTSYIKANVNGMNALHMGAELEIAYKPIKRLTFEAMVSYGDWTWQSTGTASVQDIEIQFDAKGVHVGDAAQSVYALSGRWEFVKRGYLKIQYTIYDRNYANFNPFSLSGANGGKESWRMPTYGLLNINAGYTLKLKDYDLFFRASAFNVLNALYISDATNNYNGTGFNAASANVFFGPGITWNFAIGIRL